MFNIYLYCVNNIINRSFFKDILLRIGMVCLLFCLYFMLCTFSEIEVGLFFLNCVLRLEYTCYVVARNLVLRQKHINFKYILPRSLPDLSFSSAGLESSIPKL